MTNKEAIDSAAVRLNLNNIENSLYDSKQMFMEASGMSTTDYLMHMTDDISNEVHEKFENMVQRRCSHEPLQHILGKAYFYGHEFIVNKNVLVPRPDTEILVEESLKRLKGVNNAHVLDMCTGSGCIIISIFLSGMADRAVAVDYSEKALSVAKQNASLNNADIEFIYSDLFENVSDDETFDMIVSNPPYIRTDEIPKLMAEVRDFEPHLALDGKADGLYFYDKIIREAREYLYEDGYILFEIGQDQLDAVRGLLVENGYTDIKGIKDYAGLDRIVTARYLKSCVQ